MQGICRFYRTDTNISHSMHTSSHSNIIFDISLGYSVTSILQDFSYNEVVSPLQPSEIVLKIEGILLEPLIECYLPRWIFELPFFKRLSHTHQRGYCIFRCLVFSTIFH